MANILVLDYDRSVRAYVTMRISIQKVTRCTLLKMPEPYLTR
jgi:hypothetical protein